MASSQHRCVFVGNIPYDATEEQLIEICKEVGPVVSFRLVIDRETGKPKGYGFCEYKDEETALSARRNLQGYEINGRQLRVDFAENDKGADKTREQGRGGPGLTANADPQKQMGGPALHVESILHQPIGLPSALTAATVMDGAIGSNQAGGKKNQNNLQSQSALANDPLTLQLAKMSRSQLSELMSELKGMATQNKELARQLLLSRPQLAKAIFQAQIMLGMVTPQVLHLPNIRQTPDQVSPQLLQDVQQNQQAAQNLPGLPSLALSKMQAGLMTQFPPGPVSHNLLGHNQFLSPQQPIMQPRIHPPQHVNNQVLQQAAVPGKSGVSTLHSLSSISARPQMQVGTSSSFNQQVQPRLFQHSGQSGVMNLGHTGQMGFPNANTQPSPPLQPSSLDAGYQPGSSRPSSISDAIYKDNDRSTQFTDALRSNIQSKMPFGTEKRSMIHDSSEPIRPSKLSKFDDGRGQASLVSGFHVSATGSGPSNSTSVGFSVNPVPKADEVALPDNQISQPHLAPEVESALLQQVMNLTPDQLSSLPPEQRQQVIQLQQAFRRDQIQPS